MELSKENIDNYFLLIKNLDNNDKLRLISKISDSILEKQSNEDIIANCFGKLETEESADEIIENIYMSRHFEERDISL